MGVLAGSDHLIMLHFHYGTRVKYRRYAAKIMSEQNGDSANADKEQPLEYSMDASEQFEGVHKLTETILNTIPRHADDLTQEQYDTVKDTVDRIRSIAAEHKPKVLENYDMPVGEVKDIILGEYTKGEMFYPSDISEKHGVNLDTVDEAVEQLKKEGHIADPPSLVMAAKTHEEVIKEFRSAGLAEIADRIEYLRGLAADGSDDVDFDLKSLRHMASLFLSHSGLPTPQIVVDDAGCAHATWQIPDRGIIIMVFLPSGMVKYSGIFQPAESGGQQWNARGTLPPEQVAEALRPFLSMQITN